MGGDCAGFYPEGKWITSGSDDSEVFLWEVETGQDNYPPFRAPPVPVASMAFNPEGIHMATSGGEGLTTACDKQVILLWEREDRLAAQITEHRGSVTALAFSPNGQWLASGSDDTTVRLGTPGRACLSPTIYRAYGRGDQPGLQPGWPEAGFGQCG